MSTPATPRAVNPVFVELLRGAVTESRHRAAIAVSDGAGNIVRSWGDVSRIILPRSAMKPLQAILLVESGALDAFGLGDAELALHCASHSGEYGHVERLRYWLDVIACSEEQLECAPHRPLAEQWLHLEPNECPPPSKATNNCSGKHAGFMTTARHLGVPVENYTLPDHPVQRAVRAVIADLTGQHAECMPIGCDNCGAPVYGVPISALAVAAARMATPDEGNRARAAAIKRVIAAMRAHPDLVAGTGRADTLLMEDAGFSGATKCGAEGVYMAILPDQSLGMAMKVDDGGSRAADALLVEVLHQLGAISGPTRDRLANKVNLKIHNPRGELISQIRINASGFQSE